MKLARVYIFKFGIIKNKNNKNSNKMHEMSGEKKFPTRIVSHSSWYSLLLGICRHYFRFFMRETRKKYRLISCVQLWLMRTGEVTAISSSIINETHFDSSMWMLNRKLLLYLWKTLFFLVLFRVGSRTMKMLIFMLACCMLPFQYHFLIFFFFFVWKKMTS